MISEKSLIFFSCIFKVQPTREGESLGCLVIPLTGYIFRFISIYLNFRDHSFKLFYDHAICIISNNETSSTEGTFS